MRALSLHQPHALAIALGLKPWETRDWSTRYRGPLAIHAAQLRWSHIGPWHDDARRILHRRQAELGRGFAMAYGAVVCVAELVDCVPTRELRGVIPQEDEFWGDFGDGETGMGRFAFRLRDIRVLDQPMLVRGQQGFFDVQLTQFREDRATLPLFGEG